MDSKAKRQTPPGDRISELPDEILCHLLSFLPTLHAVRTTILSTRWNNVWCTSAPISLQFDSRDFSSGPQQQTRFMRFVDCVMKLCGSSCNIRRLCLHCHSFAFKDEDFSRIHRWISTAIKNNVIDLDLYLFSNNNYDSFEKIEMPPSVFQCRSLVSLKLDTNCLTYSPSTSGCFPSLKHLHVTFRDYINEGRVKIFLNCPALEDLTIVGNVGGDVLELNISAPQMKTLTTDNLDCKFFVDAPRLENLNVNIDWPSLTSNYVLENSKSLVKAKVHVKYIAPKHKHRYPSYVPNISELLAGTSSPVNPPTLVPGCLSSHLKTVSMRGFHGEQEEVQVLKYLLHYGEVLNKITISTRNFVVNLNLKVPKCKSASVNGNEPISQVMSKHNKVGIFCIGAEVLEGVDGDSSRGDVVEEEGE
ncbi:FBD-associated F-box protein [Pyrus ussuriensis x Pyrus communis]|uniref:FBD-associated F-box protein n=1 Tax=Pyrus ussuriensis x Pyrus communis TaxID=2448454 RepID=A0A5N5GJR8_9ROSA|nr:FBD-associated F-box protein [Pyrus ussuriensis x Pyrus communis]